MKIGNRVLVTYANGSELAGFINGETPKSWKIEFDNGDQKTVRKTSKIKILDKPEPVVEKPVVEESVKPEPYIPTKYEPSKKLKRKNLLILIGILAGAALVALVVLTQLHIL
jgi:hypothetical protein